MKTKRELPSDWFCEGQGDLTDLVGDEHIHGSMPADDNEREAARQAWYQRLRERHTKETPDG